MTYKITIDLSDYENILYAYYWYEWLQEHTVGLLCILIWVITYDNIKGFLQGIPKNDFHAYFSE